MTGWVFPTRRFVESTMYNHFRLHDEEFLGVVGDHVVQIDATEAECEGEHPEWHTYEMTEDDLRPKDV